MALPEGTRCYLLAPVVRGRKGEYRKELAEYLKKGYQRVKIDGKFYEIADVPALDKKFTHDIDVVVDRIVVRADVATRLADSFEQALKLAEGLAVIELADGAASLTSPLAGEVGAKRREGGQATSHPPPQPSPARGEGASPELAAAAASDAKRLIFSEKFACPVSGFTIPEVEPRLFSFNNPFGACPKCGGLGVEQHIDADLIIPDKDATLAQGRDRAVGEVVEPVLPADAGSARQALQVRARQQMEGTAEEDPGRHPVRLRRRRHQVLLRRRHARLSNEEAVRGRHHQPGATLEGDRERLGARGVAEVFHRRAVRRLQGLPPETRGAVRQGRRPAHRRSLRNVGEARRRMVHRAAEASQRQADRDRDPRAEGNPRAAAVPGRRRARIPHPRPRLRHIERRREPAHPPRLADRLRPDRRALRAGRAVDRPAPARQRAPARSRCSACATSATP